MDIAQKTQKENEQRVAEEYLSSLSDLNCNSKPLINMLTMLAEENIEFAPVIVKVVEEHIAKVPSDFKLPILYLIDSIVKNVKSTYVQLFSQCIVNIFCGVFEKVNEKIRERMYALRQTWNEVFSVPKLYALDVKVKRMDINWPITAKQPQPSIHVNPNFLKTVNAAQTIPTDMEEILHAKTRELLELKKRKLELELEATKKHLEEQEKQLSKTTESVIPPPVDGLVASGNLPGIIPAVTPNMMPAHPPTGMGTIRPGMYQHFRNPRQQQPVTVTPTSMTNVPQNFPMNNTGKAKVHPVTPSLLNSMRQRDPRLARQQQMQHSSSRKIQKSAINPQQCVEDSRPENSTGKETSSSNGKAHTSNRSGNIAGSGFDRKSPNRHSSSSRVTGRSNKNSNRDKDRGRKRNDSRSLTTSSTGSSDRRKMGSTSSSEKSKCDDKDAFEIASLSSAFKRKSSSPCSSPTKSKETKRSPKSRNLLRNKNRSRSPSPEITTNDIDLRVKNSPDKRIKLSSASPINEKDVEKEHKAAMAVTKDLEKKSKNKQKPIVDVEEVLVPMPMLSSKDVDLRQYTSPSALTTINQAVVSSITTANVATSSPKVSFKIQKPFNKLEKSTENLSTVTSRDAVVPIDSKIVKRDFIDKVNNTSKTLRVDPSTELTKVDDDAKKRSLTLIDDDELMPKKSKQAKLDSLFGTEDVDLRTVMPVQIMAVQNQANAGIMTPPPPPVISDDQAKGAIVMEDNVCTQKKPESPTKLHPFSKKSNLDDVRAKLAKAAKYNKLGKHDKSNKEISQRINDLNMNEDTQEANDDKIRTIISQAQELLDSRSINQEQYKNLMQTVMSINETNKLKEAKRRESLVSMKSAEDMQVDSSEITAADAERMAARDAVLKKRIPKLTRDQVVSNDIKSVDSSVEIIAIDSPSHEDKNTNDSTTFKSKNNKEKRSKHSKWGDRETQSVSSLSNSTTSDGTVPHKTWLQGAPSVQFNKRSGFSGGRGPHTSIPPVPTMRMPQVPMPSPWQIGAGVNHFPNQVPIIRSSVPPPPQPPSLGLPTIPAPPAIPKPCNSIDNPQADMVRTITIDGRAKEIRIYDKIAIVFMELDQPREIGFQAGQRSIIIDNMEPIALHFNDEFKEITIDGDVHRVRFGFPSRELYIDDHWYEIYFGGPPVTIPLKNKFHTLKAEGPPPQVNIGALRRDLVLGKINMIVDAHIIIPVFLDAKIQTFRLSDKEHTIQFADNFLTVLLNGEVTQVEYGGLPKSMTLGGTKYFIRFGALPQGIVPGKVIIKDMVYIKTEPPIAPIDPLPVTTENTDVDLRKPKESVENKKDEPATISAPTIPASVLSNINIDDLFQKLVSSGILGSAITPAIEINTNISKTKTATLSDKKQPIEEPRQEVINPINLSKPETIKTRQSAIVSTLFSGMQCSSCGVRFPPEQTIKYSQHLDWHFRQNRRERDSTRKAHSRKWYYELTDWVQYEEIEDLEEREKNFFEAQQNDLETFEETSNQRSTNSPVPSCAAGPDDVDRVCDMCQEKFEQYYNEELEEWHLRSAIRIEDKIYHPLCYEDYKASLLPPKPIEKPAEEDKEEINADDDNAMDIVIKIESDNPEEPKTSVINSNDYEDEDDDVIVLPNEEPSVTEIVDDDDDDEYVPANVTREEMGTIDGEKESAESHDKELNDTAESDVEIQEPNIPFTDLDNYVEKELPEGDETSQMSFMNVKIKEEPKDDEDDEDDGFEDVGTVLIGPDEEISIQSSEGTQTHTIASSTSATSPSGDRPPSVASLNEPMESEEPTDANKSLDSTTNLEQEDEHNLSAAGPAPVGNLVNKIKINITKNIMSTNSASTTGTAIPNNLNELNTVSNNNTIATTKTTQISTIPVLCGGTSATANSSANNTAKNSSNSSSFADKGGSSNVSAISVIGSNMNVSNISVIGSYGNVSRYHHHNSRGQSQQPPQPTTSISTSVTSTTTTKVAETNVVPPAAEEVIDYELKPALKKVTLKKTKKIECGIETSGLCSIM